MEYAFMVFLEYTIIYHSFGMVSLKIACGRKPVQSQVEPNKISLVEWVRNLYGKTNSLKHNKFKMSLIYISYVYMHEFTYENSLHKIRV